MVGVGLLRARPSSAWPTRCAAGLVTGTLRLPGACEVAASAVGLCAAVDGMGWAAFVTGSIGAAEILPPAASPLEPGVELDGSGLDGSGLDGSRLVVSV